MKVPPFPLKPIFTLLTAAALCVCGGRYETASAGSFSFSTNGPDGRMAMATNPGPGERETGDDFILSSPTALTGATFTGLVTGNASSISDVVTEIYRVFPNDSKNPPSGGVPTRTNSPSDVAFETRDSGSGLTFKTAILNSNYMAANSVLNGITVAPPFGPPGGDGPVTGQEVQFTVDFTQPLNLPANHYFFVPQVKVDNGQFYWLSAPQPIVPPGTPFTPDLQTWMRNENLQPDWLRVGTDIVGGEFSPLFNAAFSLTGTTAPVPEPGSLTLVAAVALICGAAVYRKKSGQGRAV